MSKRSPEISQDNVAIFPVPPQPMAEGLTIEGDLMESMSRHPAFSRNPELLRKLVERAAVRAYDEAPTAPIIPLTRTKD